MSKAKARLVHLAGRISENQKSEIQTSEEKKFDSQKIEANRPHGEKGGFIKVCVTMPPEVYEGLVAEVTRRKVGKMSNAQLSAVVREAAVAFLGGARVTRPR